MVAIVGLLPDLRHTLVYAPLLATGIAIGLRPYRLTGLMIGLGMCLALWRIEHLAQPVTVPPDTSLTMAGHIIEWQPLSNRNGYRIRGQLAYGVSLITGDIWIEDTAHWPPLPLGTRVRVTGKTRKQIDADFARWNTLRGIATSMRSPQVQIHGQVPLPVTERLLGWGRASIANQAAQAFPEPAASLLIGLLTGDRSRIPARVTESFRRTGLTHLLAVSGGNVAQVLLIVNLLCWWLPKRHRLWPMLLAIVGFAIFTGLSASVVRASIMAAIGATAMSRARPTHAWRHLALAAAGMLLWNPRWLWWDIGFQLSFLAVAGLLTFSQRIQSWLQHMRPVAAREALSMTLAAQLATEPCILYHFGTLAVVSPLANILVTPVIPAAAILGGFSLGLHALWPIIAVPAMTITLAILLWTVFVTDLLGSLPFAIVNLTLPPWSIIGIAVVIWSTGLWYTWHDSPAHDLPQEPRAL